MQESRQKIIQQLFENMNAVKRSMHGQLQALDKRMPIPHAQQELLLTIRTLQPVTFKQLAERLYLTPGAVSQLAQGLEEHELIIRKTDPADRRKQLLHISKKGTKLLQDMEKRRRKFMETILTELSDEELQIWLRIQQKMIKQYQTQLTDETN